MLAQQLILSRRAFRRRRIEGRPEGLGNGRLELRQFLVERFSQVPPLLLGDFGRDLIGFLGDGGHASAIGLGVERNPSLRRDAPILPVECGLEDGSQAIIIVLQDRVVAVVVALGAANRQPQQRGRDDFDRIGDVLVGGGRTVGGGRAVGRHSQKSRRTQLLDGVGRQIARVRRHQLVTSQLLGDELVERFVGVESANHVIAIVKRLRPGYVLLVKAFRVGVARRVEPVASPTFTVVRRG